MIEGYKKDREERLKGRKLEILQLSLWTVPTN